MVKTNNTLTQDHYPLLACSCNQIATPISESSYHNIGKALEKCARHTRQINYYFLFLSKPIDNFGYKTSCTMSVFNRAGQCQDSSFKEFLSSKCAFKAIVRNLSHCQEPQSTSIFKVVDKTEHFCTIHGKVLKLRPNVLFSC